MYNLLISEQKKLNQIAQSFGVELTFTKEKGTYCELKLNEIVIGLKDWHTFAEVLSAFFHELGHLYCAWNGKFAVYHSGETDVTKMSTSDLRIFLKTALKAERYVDMLGEQFMAEYFPGLNYVPSYNTDHAGEFLLEYYQEIRGELKMRKAA